MAILLWLLPAAVATCVAMAVVGWVGRERTASERQRERAREKAQERFARAMERPQPGSVRVRPTRVRSTGVAVRAVRPSGKPGESEIRRSA